MNEYVHPDIIDDKWVKYEPIERIPAIKGSLKGTIYNGSDSLITFHPLPDGRITGNCSGFFDNQTGIIKIFYDRQIHEENFLCVSYEQCDYELPQKSNWLQGGF